MHFILILCYIIAGLYFPIWCLIGISQIHPKRVTKAQVEKSKAKTRAKRRKRKRSRIVEPYDDPKDYFQSPLDYDIDGFWKSYTKNHAE